MLIKMLCAMNDQLHEEIVVLKYCLMKIKYNQHIILILTSETPPLRQVKIH